VDGLVVRCQERDRAGAGVALAHLVRSGLGASRIPGALTFF
jgi:hypothetical protein